MMVKAQMCLDLQRTYDGLWPSPASRKIGAEAKHVAFLAASAKCELNNF